MARVAKQWIVWHSDPKMDEDGNVLLKKVRGVELEEPDQDRIEIAMDAVVPDVVPEEVQEDWEKRGMVLEDPTREHIAKQEGPPRALMPPVLAQKIEHTKKVIESRRVPHRPRSEVQED